MIACFGYEVSFKGASFYYSGDAHDIPDSVLKKFLNNKINLLFHEATIDTASAGHCSYTTLERKIPVSERYRVYFFKRLLAKRKPTSNQIINWASLHMLPKLTDYIEGGKLIDAAIFEPAIKVVGELHKS